MGAPVVGLQRVAGRHNVKGRSIVPDDPTEGRTYYIGARTSDVRVRLYEKTAEARSRLGQERWHEIPEDWVRLECQVRPRKEFKAVASSVSPAQAWGFSGWSTELAKEAFEMQLERIEMQAGRETDYARTYRFFSSNTGLFGANA